MTAPRTFHIGDILSATTGFLVSPRHMDGVHELLGFMAGEPIWTHQLPRVVDEAAPSLREQFPDLAAIQTPVSFEGRGHVESWLAGVVAEHGETREVLPLAAVDHTSVDPITELQLMGHGHKVIVVDGAA